MDPVLRRISPTQLLAVSFDLGSFSVKRQFRGSE
jgi:hypothetical protein